MGCISAGDFEEICRNVEEPRLGAMADEIPIQMQALLELMAEEGLEFQPGPSREEVLEKVFSAKALEEIAQRALLKSWEELRSEGMPWERASSMTAEFEENPEVEEEEVLMETAARKPLKCLISGKAINFGDYFWMVRGLGPVHLEVTLEQVQTHARSQADS